MTHIGVVPRKVTEPDNSHFTTELICTILRFELLKHKVITRYDMVVSILTGTEAGGQGRIPSKARDKVFILPPSTRHCQPSFKSIALHGLYPL